MLIVFNRAKAGWHAPEYYRSASLTSPNCHQSRAEAQHGQHAFQLSACLYGGVRGGHGAGQMGRVYGSEPWRPPVHWIKTRTTNVPTVLPHLGCLIMWRAALRGRHTAYVEVAELVLKYIQALIWPTVILALLWTWRDRVGEAIGRLSRVETPAGALEFQNEARRVRDRAAAVAEEEAASTGPVPEPEPLPEPEPRPQPASSEEPTGEAVRRRLLALFMAIDQPDDVIERSPTGAIVSAWNALQTFAEEILTLYPSVQPRRPGSGWVAPGELVRMLQVAGLDPEAVDVMNDLRSLRNTTVHGTAVVTPQAAHDFVRGCMYVAYTMEDLAWPGRSPADGTSH